jgi:hypothetical protein
LVKVKQSRKKQLEPSDSEDEDTMIRRNIGIYRPTHRNIPEHLNLQQHRCENNKTPHATLAHKNARVIEDFETE